MKKIWQVMGFEAPTEGMFGVEIEAEGQGIKEVQNDLWKTVPDGSLRGAYPDQAAEFVFKKPLHIGDAHQALQDLEKIQKDAEFSFSFRTSVHIHLNVSNLTEDEFFAVLYTYYLLEEVMVHSFGRERKGNRFCLRLQDADAITDLLNDLADKGVKRIADYHEMHIRYSALNLASLKKYGSIEFRAMKGNLNVEFISECMTRLQEILFYGVRMKNVMNVYNAFINKSPEQFVDEVFNGALNKVYYRNMTKDIQRSFCLSINLPFLLKLAKERQKEVEEEVPQVKVPAVRKLRQAALQRGGIIDVPDPALVFNFDEIINEPIGAMAEFRIEPMANPQGEW